jgi:hypothetical protein
MVEIWLPEASRLLRRNLPQFGIRPMSLADDTSEPALVLPKTAVFALKSIGAVRHQLIGKCVNRVNGPHPIYGVRRFRGQKPVNRASMHFARANANGCDFVDFSSVRRADAGEGRQQSGPPLQEFRSVRS